MFVIYRQISLESLDRNFKLEFKGDEKLLKVWDKINSNYKSTRWISIKFTPPLNQSVISIYLPGNINCHIRGAAARVWMKAGLQNQK